MAKGIPTDPAIKAEIITMLPNSPAPNILAPDPRIA